MKGKILLIFLTAISFNCYSQTGVKLFGYIQEVLPGTIPKGTDENGKKLRLLKNNLIILSISPLRSKLISTPLNYGLMAISFLLKQRLS